ncbi:carbohydrate kinase family protein [Anaerobacillus sp. CMMVII]|nr:carbohydrate kinase family protein [Anaerobacillus sp. CMMVII]
MMAVYQVPVIDTTGAGDYYSSSLTLAIASGQTFVGY